MNREKLKTKYQEKDLTPLKVKDIISINHSPHPFCIGSEHVAFVNTNYSVALGDSCFSDPAFPTCSMRGCNLPYDAHTCDDVLAMELTKNATNMEVQIALSNINDEVTDDGLDGYIFVENEFEFITEDTTDEPNRNGNDVQ